MANKSEKTTIHQHVALDDTAGNAVWLGQNVTRLRKAAKITKQKFALMVGIGRPFLNRIEKGIADPRLSVVNRLADALDTTPQALLSEPCHTQPMPHRDHIGHARLD